MSATPHRTPKLGRKSLLFQDLATPVSVHREKFSSPSQAAAVSALRRENLGGSDLPPPPMNTLDNRSDFSPESGVADYSVSPEVNSDRRTPFHSSGKNFVTPGKGATTSFSLLDEQAQQSQQVSESPSRWSQSKAGNSTEQDDKEKGSPVEGVIKPGELVILPPLREVARPEVQRQIIPIGNLEEEEEWITVYGFSPSETNLVLREFEKCGMILKHVPGPRNANWMHILYQTRSDAQKALNKAGMMINGVVIVGVKPVDPIQRQALERLNNQEFMPLLPTPSTRESEFITARASSRPQYLQNGSAFIHQPSGGAMAAPSNSMVSKFCDMMFGF